MDRANHVEQHLVAYCIGNPQDLSHRKNLFYETLEEMRMNGQEIWHISDRMGVILHAGRMYIWTQVCVGEDLVEGQIFEFNDIEALLASASELCPELTIEQKMTIVRQLQVRHALHRQ